MSSWVSTQLSARQEWAPGLATLRLGVALQFKPGQFVNVALTVAGTRQRRSYSLASAPGEPAELYINRVQDGGLSPHLLALRVGDTLELDSNPAGFFTLDEFAPGGEAWFLATGSGLGPFVSMIRSGVALQHCERVVVVHGVREVAQLGYRDELVDYARAHSQRFTYVPVISREPPPRGALAGRIPALIQDGQLEGRAGLRFDPGYSRVLLCGNPQMIVDVKQVLQGRGLELHRRRKPGHILSENYW